MFALSALRSLRSLRGACAGAVVVLSGLAASCSESLVQTSLPIGGTCLSCHEDITDMHPAFALACVDCHGGDDQVPALAANLKAKGEDVFVVDVRDQKLLRASHVLPEDPSLWWANGVDDDEDGAVDEAGEFFDGRIAGEALAPRKQFDSEINSDINYLRFLNPGDLRVAAVTCGSRNKNANNAAMVCHADVVYDVRRSLMANNPAVPAGANYGNAQRPRAADFGAAFAASDAGARFDARDARIGRVGYAYDYDALDDAYDVGENAYDAVALAAVARENADVGDDDKEAVAGALVDDGSDEDDPGVGRTRFGNTLKFPDRAVDVLQPIPSRGNRTWPDAESALALRLETLVGGPLVNGFDGEGLTNPVDAALRHFRPYQTLNVTGTNDNFGAVDFSQSPVLGAPPPPDVDDTDLAHQNNPFGRGRPSGCTACHVPYRNDGKNEEPKDRTVADNGRQPSLDLPFGMRPERGERFYPRRHELKRTVELETCGSCHGFVTRVDLAYSGATENEGDLTRLPEKIVNLSTTFTTPRGTPVKIFENIARFTDGAVDNDGEGVSEDKNGNGELDAGEDADGDGVLALPDREARSASFDGRQPRIVYGGANGSTRLADVHFQAGMVCVDCHSQQDVHGDGNIYTRNWDAIEIECDDCHGTPSSTATLVSSGPNGGTDLSKIRTAFGEPWLTHDGDGVVQHSRARKGLSWRVPQLKSDDDDEAAYAHRQPLESGPARPGEARALAHIAEPGKPGGLECYACHTSWQPNCLDCHAKMDVAKPVQEQWYGDAVGEEVFFQLFSFTRSPFLLGRAGDVEGNKIGTWRATQEVFLTVTAGPVTLADSVVFSTERHLSSLASNPYFPHTVRTKETKSCARCHSVVDDAGRAVADHLLSESTAEGTGRYDLALDWAFVVDDQGLSLLDTKRESARAAAGGVSFPGFDHDGSDVRAASFAVAGARDVAVVRGVSAVDGSGDVTDVAFVAHDDGVSVVDVFGRDNAALPPFELARFAGHRVRAVDVVDGAASQSPRFVAVADDGVFVVDVRRALSPDRVARALGGARSDDALDVVSSFAFDGRGVTRLRLLGRYGFIAGDGGVDVVEFADAVPAGASAAAVDLGAVVGVVAHLDADFAADVAVRGRFAWVACAEGVVGYDVGALVFGADADVERVAVIDLPAARGVAVFGNRLWIADEDRGVVVVDVSVAADPVVEEVVGGPVATPLRPRALQISATPVRVFALVLDAGGPGGAGPQPGLRIVDMTSSIDVRARPSTRATRYSFERLDPLTPFDARSAHAVIDIATRAGAPRALARGVALDRLQDGSGRPLRDNWSIGAAPLDDVIVRRMRDVVVRDLGGADERGDGFGCLVRVGDRGVVDGDGCHPSIVNDRSDP